MQDSNATREATVFPSRSKSYYNEWDIHYYFRLQEKEEHHEAERDESAHDNAVSPLPRRYLADDRVKTRDLARGHRDPPVDAGEGLSLHNEVFVGGVRLAEHAVYHVVAVVDAVPLV